MSSKGGSAVPPTASRFRRALVVYNWCAIALTVILCLVPLLKDSTMWLEGYPVDNYAWLKQMTNATTLDTSAVYAITHDDQHYFAPLAQPYHTVESLYSGMAIPTAMDLLLELYTMWTQGDDADHNVVRMSWAERAVFVLGVLSLNMVYLCPASWNIFERYAIDNVFETVNTIMTMGPVLIFLERNTKNVFSAPWTSCIITLLGAGCALFSLALTIPDQSLNLKTYKSGEYLITAASGLILLTCLWSLVQHVRKHHATSANEHGKQLQLDAHADADDDFFTNVVPAYHMLGLCIASVFSIAWWNSTSNFSSYIIALIPSTALVFVIEMRIRQHDVTVGLHKLDSKRQFVRFLAHEIRTPLSTAAMGLELYRMGFAQTGGVGDDGTGMGELQEYLALVQESFETVGSIVDNLIDFDLHGHEKDTMVLHYEVADAADVVSTVAAPLQLHARRSAVNLHVVGGGASGSGRSSVGVEVDRRRIAQALRALVATAIDTTAKGGEVTVTVRPAANLTASSLGGQAKNTGPLPKRGSLLNTKAGAPTLAPGPSRRRSLLDKPVPQSKPATASGPFSRWLARRKSASTTGATDLDAMARFVVIEIVHGGPGFAKADAKRVNRETFTFNPNEIHGGGGGAGGGTQSGLGLSLAKVIVEAHGGRVFVSSDGVGKGSTFVVGLPISSMPSPPSTTQPSRPPPPPSVLKDLTSTSQYVEVDGWRRASTKSSIGGTAASDSPMPLTPIASILAPGASTKETGDASVAAECFSLSLAHPAFVGSGGSGGSGGGGGGGGGGVDTGRSPKEDGPTTPTSPPPVGGSSRASDGETTRALHVLVVEDAPVARTMLVRLLKTMKHTADEAEDGQQAVDKVRAALADPSARLYDMILCDSVMPVMDGPTAVQIIRGLGYDGPILGVTGNTLPEQIADFIQHGADEVVTKPVKLPVLKAMMAQWSGKESGALTAHKNTENTSGSWGGAAEI